MELVLIWMVGGYTLIHSLSMLHDVSPRPNPAPHLALPMRLTTIAFASFATSIHTVLTTESCEQKMCFLCLVQTGRP